MIRPAPTPRSRQSRWFARTVGARLPPQTPGTLSLLFGSDLSPHQLTRAQAMSWGGGYCWKNDLSLSPCESKSLRRSRLRSRALAAPFQTRQGMPCACKSRRQTQIRCDFGH